MTIASRHFSHRRLVNQLYPDEGLVKWLDRMTLADLSYTIFSNDITPTLSTTYADLTIPSITPVTVSAADFIIKSVAAHIGTALAAPIEIVNDSGGPINGYGYVVTGVSQTEILAIARFDDAPQVKSDTVAWNVIPIFGDFSSVS